MAALHRISLGEPSPEIVRSSSTDEIEAWRVSRRSSVAFDTGQKTPERKSVHWQNDSATPQYTGNEHDPRTGMEIIFEAPSSTERRRRRSRFLKESNTTLAERRRTDGAALTKEIDEKLEAVRKSLSPEFMGAENAEKNEEAGKDWSILDDESAAATVIGQGFYKKQALFGKLDGFSKNEANNNISMLNESVFDSPTGSRIFGLNESMIDNSLLVTPVLDRYRLEFDDSSVGIKVVPNDRRKRIFLSDVKEDDEHRSRRVASHKENHRALSAETINTTEKDFQQNTAILLSPNVSIRKTPKNKAHASAERTAPLARKRSPFHHVSTNELSTMTRNSPLAESKIACSTPTRYSAPIFPCPRKIDMDLPFRKSALRGRQSSPRLSGRWENGGMAISSISIEEYEAAPRVVRTQVQMNEANNAAFALNSHIEKYDLTPDHVIMTEEECCRIIQQPARKTKSILMSLCHWRRLNMVKGDTSGKMCFAPNQKIRPSRVTM